MSRRVVHRGVFLLLMSLVLAAAACSDPYEETGPADEIAIGELCTPAATGCPSSKLLRRTSALGANRLDFQLTNEGSTTAEITVAALPPDTQPADATTLGDIGPDLPSVDLVSRTYTLSPGEAVADRFVQEALFTRASFRLLVRCDGCTALLEYALGSEPLECRADDDCSGGWICRETVGRCVECLDDDDCADTQTCSLTNYRCGPEEASGCSQTRPLSSSGPLDSPLPYTLGALLLVGFAARRDSKLLVALLAAGCILTVASAAYAEPPHAALNLGMGSRFLTGDLGDQTERGIGISISQELRTTYFGGRVELGANYFLTTQDAPPLSHELQMYSVAIGPQAYIPAGPVQIVVGLDYRHVGLVSNSLVRFTGPGVNYSAAGGSVELKYRMAPLELMLRGGFHPVFGLDSSLFSVDLAVGLATGE